MREILLIAGLGALGWYTYTLQQDLKGLEKANSRWEGTELSPDFVGPPKFLFKEDLEKAEGRAQKAEEALKEASRIGLEFKEELDSTREKLKEAEEVIFALRARITDITVSKNSIKAPTSRTYIYGGRQTSDKVKEQIEILLKNYNDGLNLLSQAQRREGNYARPATLRSNFSASSVDRQRYEDWVSSEISRLKTYVSTVESKLRSLGYQF